MTAGAEAVADRPFAWHYLRALGERAFPDYAATLDRARANYLGMLRLLDDQLRRLYDGLAARHAQRQRVFVATADHGDFVGEYGLMRKGAEIPDVLARVPLVVTGDAIEPGGGAAHPAHVSLADLLPTCCAAMGAAVPAGVQGRSLWPLLTGAGYPAGEFASAYVEQGIGGLPYEAGDADEPMPGLAGDPPDGTARFDALNAVTQGGRRRKVRSGDWALDADLTGQFRLYNLAEDPAEQHDRWPEPGVEPVRTALLQLLAVWQLRSEDPLPSPPNGYRRKQDPHGYLAPYATLPAVSHPSRVVPDRFGDPAPDRGDGRA